MSGIDKIIKGILRYRKLDQTSMLDAFKRFQTNPTPGAVFFTCMDSRLLPSKILNSEVGDNFVVRNAGNMVPHSKHFSFDSASTEPGALELGCIINNIKHVVVCGHSDCKAMHALYGMRHDCGNKVGSPLQIYLKKHGQQTVSKFETLEKNKNLQGPLTFQGASGQSSFEAYIDPDNLYEVADKFSQVNTLEQLQNIASYDFLRNKLLNNEVKLHALWFDIHSGNCLYFSQSKKRFIEISQENYDHLIQDAHSNVH